MSTHARRVSIVAVLGLVLALFAWVLPGNANAVSEEPSQEQVAAVATSPEEPAEVAGPEEAAPEEAAPVEVQPSEEVVAENPVPAENPVEAPAANPVETPVENEPVGEQPVEDDFVPSNPDNLPEGYEGVADGTVDYNVFPVTEFGSAPKIAPRAVRAANTDHPTEPGEVKVFKDATPVEGMLNTWDVTLRIEGKDAPTTSDIVLVIDRSGSMNDLDRMQAAKAAANAFVDELLPSDNTRIGVVSFASGVRVDQPLTNNSSNLKGAINGLGANGGTFTQAGVHQARALLTNSDADFKHIVLLSDGEPTYSYRLQQPDNYLQPWGIRQETTANAPESAYRYNQTVGDGTDLHTRYASGRYYNHGNSAIAEAGFAANDGYDVWTVGLQTNYIGSGILQQMAKGSGTFTEVTDVNDLTPVFQEIAGNIAAAVKNANVNDPMGAGFEIPVGSVDSIRVSPRGGTASYDRDTSTLTWVPGTLTEPIEPGSDVKYAEITYRITINDDILDLDEPADGLYPTNENASVSYTDANGDTQNMAFPVPKVDPVLVTIEKKLYKDNGELVTEPDEDWNKEFSIKAAAGDYDKTYTVKPNQRVLLTAVTDSNGAYVYPEGTYTFEEIGDISDYTVTYEVDGVAGNTVNVQRSSNDHAVVVQNKPAFGKLAINKNLAGDATEKAESLTYTGTYECWLGNENNITAVGNWTVTGAGNAMLTPNTEGATASETVDVKVNSECEITETPVTIEDDAAQYYTVGDVSIEQPQRITKNQTSTATVTNTLNKNLGSVVWNKVEKVDPGTTPTPLGGSEWKLTGPGLPEGGKQIQDVNNDGVFGADEDLINLEWGEYTLVETLAPAGYIVDKTEHKFTVGDVEDTDGLNIDLGDITNTKVVGPTIPLTGGISRDAFLLGGGIFIALGLMVYGAYAIRRQAN